MVVQLQILLTAVACTGSALGGLSAKVVPELSQTTDGQKVMVEDKAQNLINASERWGMGQAVLWSTRGTAVREHRAASENRKVIWVMAYPRSMSSTLLSMVSVTSGPSTDSFSLFEPCHNGDKIDRALNGCRGLLEDLSQCRFDRVNHLWGWGNKHSSGYHLEYTPARATSMCSNANRVSFKTIHADHNISQWIDFLDANPNLHMVNAIRDPRGIWASWKSMKTMSDKIRKGTFYTLEQVCAAFASNLGVAHPRVKHVLFEDTVKNPHKAARDIYAALNLKVEVALEHWVTSNFNNKACIHAGSLADCRADSESMAQKWRTKLTQEELQRFRQDENCQKVKIAYNFGD